MIYNWQQPDWTQFEYELDGLEDMLVKFVTQMSELQGILKASSEAMKVEVMLDTMVAEAIKTSEIEGEYLSRQDVVSSIRNNLGLNKNPELVKDQRSRGAAELMVAVRNSFAEPLTEETLLAWHTMLLRQDKSIAVGAWRLHEDPMQVISGGFGKEKVHFEAPPSSQVPREISQFLSWFNDTQPGGPSAIKSAPVRSAIAHLYFETIHPFEDGNGRIGRAIAEKAISQTIGHPVMLSLSQTIEADKKAYYEALEKAQRSKEITPWLTYFVALVLKAQQRANSYVEFVLKKAKLYDRFKSQLNERQLKVITRMLDAGPDGFEGGINAKKYIGITKASKATVTRDLQHLLELGLLSVEGGGRSTRYSINFNL